MNTLNFNALQSQIHETRIHIIEKFMNAKQISKQQINERILKIQQNQSLKPSKKLP
jgi:hypothetical protein